MTTIPASYDTLFGQAKDAVQDYFYRARNMLDESFGEGYAEKNPALVGQLVTAMATEMSGATFGKSVGEVADVLSNMRFND